MNAAQPLALLLAALALPTIAAYLHRRKRETKTVSSTLLFRVIAGNNTPTRRAMAQPRHLVSLVLMVLALLTLVLAVVDLRDESNEPRDFVVVLDTSASMGAKVPGSDETRLDAARERLETAIEAMGPGDRVALVTAGESNVVRIGFTEDYGRVLELAQAQSTAGSSDALPQALRIADALARAREATVVLLTDGVGVGIPEMAAMPQLVSVGQAGPNVGINALAVREADALGLTEVFLAVTGNVTDKREVEVALRVDGSIVDVIPLTIPPSGRVERLHRAELPEGTQLVASLQNHGEDVLAADDVATAPRGAGDRVKVLLVAKTRVSFTAEALRLHPRVDLTIIGPYDSAPLPAYDLILLETEHRAGELPTSGHLLSFGTDPTTFGLPVGKHIASPRILRWSFDDPLFRFVDFTDIDLPRSNVLVQPGEQVTSLVDSENGALVVRSREEDREIVYFGFSPAESDLVLRVGFVNLVANVVEWAAPAPESSEQGPVTAVLPASETALNPPRAIPGTVPGNFDRRAPADRPLWQLLLWLAAGLMVIEGLLPTGRGLFGRLHRLWLRRRGFGRRRQGGSS